MPDEAVDQKPDRVDFEEGRKVALKFLLKDHPGLTERDFDGIKPSQFEAKAAELQADRQTQAEEFLRQALLTRGFDGENLDQALAALKAPPAEQPDESPESRAASLGALGGRPPRSHRDDAPDTGRTMGDRILDDQIRKAARRQS